MGENRLIRAQDLNELAAKLGRPPTGLTAFRDLTPEQFGLLSDLVDAARERERQAVQEGLRRAIPLRPVRRLVIELLRERRR